MRRREAARELTAMLWIAFILMAGLATAIALWPLAFRRRAEREVNREAAFHRAQLQEIARDVERGVLPADEAAGARAEAGRRLLAASEPDAVVPTPGALGRRRAAGVAALVFVPALALAVYFRVGQPDLPDAPLAQRMNDRTPTIEEAVARVEAHLMKTPDDRRGWELLAPIYMRLGRFADAAGAYRTLIRLGEDTPVNHAELGEALVVMSNGVVTADARAEFDKAPDLPMSKFYAALGLEQDGKKDEALAAYKALEPQATGRAPWMAGLRRRLAELTGAGPPLASNANPPPAEAAAPSQEAAAPQGETAAPAFSADQRQMIEGMVRGLADRLATKGGSPEEWSRLIRAYSVLHEQDKARDALASARKALGKNPDIDALARELGLEG